MLANVLTNEKICHSIKICNTRRVFVSVCNKFGTFASLFPPDYEYRPIWEASPKFQRVFRMLSFTVNIRKQSQAIGSVGKAFGSICNVRKAFVRRLQRSPFPIPCECLVTVKFKKTMSPASYSLRIFTIRSLVIKYSHHS